jgi:hypothetical protein
MCDYSLESVASRQARVADRLVSTSFVTSFTRGFASVDDPDTAVCVMPGTEIAFDEEVAYEKPVTYEIVHTAAKVARFRQINLMEPRSHHDALEFPGGQVVLLSRLVPGQCATVLQLPAAGRGAEPGESVIEHDVPVAPAIEPT